MVFNIPCYARFQWINHRRVRDILRIALRPPRIGRKGYDKVRMFKWLMYKQVMGCSYRDLEGMTGIDHSTFVKFRSRLIRQNWFAVVYHGLTSGIAPQLHSITAILDSSFVETYSRHDEQGSEYNGFKEKNGFKLHQLIDFQTRLPLCQIATPGARSDIRIGEVLIRGAPRTWKIRKFTADKGYDGANFVKFVSAYWPGIRISIPLRHMKKDELLVWRRIKGWERTWDRQLLKKRTEIERYFSRKKRVFGLGEERTRHLKNFRANCELTSIMEILEWSTKPQIYGDYSPDSLQDVWTRYKP